MRKYLVVLLTLLVTSCLEEVDLEVDTLATQFLLDGQVLDTEVRVHLTVSALDSISNNLAESPYIFSLVLPDGQVVALPLDTSCACYRRQGSFTEVGNYTLIGRGALGDIDASDNRPATPQLRSIFFRSFEDRADRLEVRLNDPADQTNFYRLVVERNGSRVNPQQMQLLRDNVFNGNVGSFLVDINPNPNDTIVVRLQSLSADYFLYLTALQLLQEQGGITGTTTGNPVSNLPDNILGYFSAVAEVRDTLVFP